MDITILITTEDTSEYTTYPFLEKLVPRLIDELVESGGCEPYFDANLERGFYESGPFIESMKELVEKNSGYTLILIHQDAEAPSQENVIKYKFNPLFEVLSDSITRRLVKVIPVRMIEAWLCADSEAFHRVSYLDDVQDNSVFPNNTKNVKSIQDPKSELKQYISKNPRTGKRRRINLNDLYEPLGSKVNIAKLKKVPAFKEFRKDLKNALNALNP